MFLDSKAAGRMLKVYCLSMTGVSSRRSGGHYESQKVGGQAPAFLWEWQKGLVALQTSRLSWLQTPGREQTR